MTKMKFCGLTRACDIAAVNTLKPDYIGFVFAKKSKRYATPEQAKALKALLDPEIPAVGVFVNEPVESVAALLEAGIIDIAQLHGDEDEAYIAALREKIDRPVIKAFKVKTEADLAEVEDCTADYVLLDSGAGTGKVFDWQVLQHVTRPYFLAGGLSPENAAAAVAQLHPYALDVSSGIESEGVKDPEKMAEFAAAVRKEDQK